MVDALKKKQTITSTALRLGTFRLVLSGSFFPYSWNGQWNNRPMGPFDMSSRLETLVLVREVIRTANKIKIPLRLKFALCVSTNIIHVSIAGPLARL